jgi:tRNA-uridine 2-sulfurtransferase
MGSSVGSLRKVRVLAGLSGGVDSSVAALLLARRGLDVTGVTMVTGPGRDAHRSACSLAPDSEGVDSARRVCRDIGIPHLVVDLTGPFESQVLEGFRRAYAGGLTPNPCVLCNRDLKLGLLPARAAEIAGRAFDLHATGHYAALGECPSGRHGLFAGADAGKDQSYFLAMLTQKQLARLELPLGELTKARAREIARGMGWTELAARRGSQDFAGGDLGALLGDFAMKPGPIVHIDGRTVGRHIGAALFTVGQRRGLGVGGNREPLFVVSTDPGEGVVRVGPRSSLLSRSLQAAGMNWVAWERPPASFRASVKIRSRHEPAVASISVSHDGGSVEALFDEPQFAVTPGQLAVLYQGGLVLGAGWIVPGGQPGR